MKITSEFLWVRDSAQSGCLWLRVSQEAVKCWPGMCLIWRVKFHCVSRVYPFRATGQRASVPDCCWWVASLLTLSQGPLHLTFQSKYLRRAGGRKRGEDRYREKERGGREREMCSEKEGKKDGSQAFVTHTEVTSHYSCHILVIRSR